MRMSQRTGDFKGGIQKGQNATDTHARKLDKQCKEIRDRLVNEFPNLTMKRKLPKHMFPNHKGACEPDGGAWFLDGVLVAVFEGKKQGLGGNAIERWFKNNFICRKLNPSVSYVTFCVGEGAGQDRVIHNTLDIAHEKGFNEFFAGENSCFLSEGGFTDEEIYNTMRKALSAV